MRLPATPDQRCRFRRFLAGPTVTSFPEHLRVPHTTNALFLIRADRNDRYSHKAAPLTIADSVTYC